MNTTTMYLRIILELILLTREIVGHCQLLIISRHSRALFMSIETKLESAGIVK